MRSTVGTTWGLAALGLVCGALCVHCGGDDAPNNPGGDTNQAGAGGDGEGGGDSSPGGAASPQGGEGGSGNAGEPGMAGAGAGGELVVTGDHHGYVLDQMELPANDAQMKEIAIDLDGNGKADNRLGTLWSTLSAQNFLPNMALNDAVQNGTVLMLADIQTPSLETALAASFTTFYGTNPMPAPCVKIKDCGHHLLGTGAFDVDMQHLGEPAIGTIQSSELKASGGKLPLRLMLGGAPLDLVLEHPVVDAKALTDADMGPVLIGGAFSPLVVDAQILPAFKDGGTAFIDKDCTKMGADCGCTMGSTGATIISSFDADKSCSLTVEELKMNMALSALLSPDLDFDGDKKPEMLSVVVRATAKKATFDVP